MKQDGKANELELAFNKVDELQRENETLRAQLARIPELEAEARKWEAVAVRMATEMSAAGMALPPEDGVA